MEEQHIAHLRDQFELGRPILFTGSGFSLEARNAAGKSMPSVDELKRAIWQLCWPSEEYEAGSTLPDLFQAAIESRCSDLVALLKDRLTVEPSSLPEMYRGWFALPWTVIYTLNTDTLVSAVGAAFELPYRLRTVSASKYLETPASGVPVDTRAAIHLNGTLDEPPDEWTFASSQYAMRQVYPDPVYMQFAAECAAHPVVFVGTTIDEPSMWQFIQMRQARGSRREVSELRPRSYLVTPKLDRAKQSALASFNIAWVPMTAREFADEVIPRFEEASKTFYAQAAALSRSGRDTIAEVTDLTERKPEGRSLYLLGAEPSWDDIVSGRAAERDVDRSLCADVVPPSSDDGKSEAITITGTAGCGKSSCLMRLCLHLSAAGERVAWVDKESDVSPREMVKYVGSPDGARVLAVDDADMYRAHLSQVYRKLARGACKPILVVMAVRSSKADRVLPPPDAEVLHKEVVVPKLSDADIRSILDVLDREGRLGVLRGKAKGEQVRAFKDRARADRQLLVAMLEATSGERFEERLHSEFSGLEGDAKLVYAIVSVATHARFSLCYEDIMLAANKANNLIKNATDNLIRRGILVWVKAGQLVRARHRVVADVIHDHLVSEGRLREVYERLAFLGAVKAAGDLARRKRWGRFLRHFINHDIYLRVLGLEQARKVYDSIEELLDKDYHFWLQRGAMELEAGDLKLAQHWLDQARGIAPSDGLVQTEHAYLQLKLSLQDPYGERSEERVEDAAQALEAQIAERGWRDPYPAHVLGSQGLAWARRGIRSRFDRRVFLKRLLDQLEQAKEQHPRDTMLPGLLVEVRHDWMMTAVRNSGEV